MRGASEEIAYANYNEILVTTASSLTGTTILHYRVGRRLGSGGMGDVYIAEDTRLGRQVALKFLRVERQRDEESRARLIREARAASLLQSPNIAVTYDLVEHGDLMFISMEYVEGELIAERVARGPLPVVESVDIAAQVASALEEAHGRNIIHRDIKSANLVQTRRGLVKVLDFGLAKMDLPGSSEASLRSTSQFQVTAPGMVLGTMAYMAPEQLRGEEVDYRVDLFALGVVMYEMLAGQLPFRGRTLAEIFDAILHRDPEPFNRSGDIPPDLELIVRRSLQKVPSRRYQSARDLYDNLRHLTRKLEAGVSSTGIHVPLAELGQRSLAVLTFTNLTREPADDWIGTGIAETLAADLRNVQNLDMISRAQVFEMLNTMQTGATPADDRLAIEIGKRLGAWWVVSGGYQRLGDRIRITAQLTEVWTGTLLRTVKIDGRVEEIFELQDRIVFDLSRSLDAKLGREEAAAIEHDDTTSVEAFEAYSRGVLNLRSAGRESIDRAITLFERAVALDPAYGVAWAALGGAYNLKAQFSGFPDLHHRAIEHLRRALSLKPSLVSAYVWLGSSLLYLGNVDEGIEALKHAEALDSDDADVHQALARANWMWRADIDEAVRELRRSIALNPEAGYSHLQLAFLEALNGHLDEAEAAAREAIELQERAMSGTEGLLIVGAHARLGYVYYRRREYDAALVEYRRELAYVSTSDHALRERTLIELHQKLSALHAARGEAADAARFGDLAIAAHERRVAAGADDPATRYYIAAVYAQRGDVDQTKHHLALPLQRLPAFTRWRLPRDIDFDPVRERLSL
jgi:serine/threonine protein kinase/tetratricopeptide (TPR) repeat protein